jgi:hypothetical protein
MLSARLAALTISAVTLAVAGCGSSSSSTTAGSSSATGTSSNAAASAAANGGATAGGSSSSLSQSELASNANAICKRMHGRLLALSKGKTPSLEQAYLLAVSYERKALSELKKLSPPVSLAGDWRQIITTLSVLAEDSTKYVEYTKAKNTNAATILSHAYSPIKHMGVNAAAHDGINECALAL